MKISATFYNDADELMAPRPLDVKLGSVTPGGIPSIEEGFYHRFKFEGRTEAEYLDKYRQFFANMRQVQGYSTLVRSPYTVQMGSYVRYGLDVLYVVEAEGGAASAASTTAELFPGANRYPHTPSVNPSTPTVIATR